MRLRLVLFVPVFALIAAGLAGPARAQIDYFWQEKLPPLPPPSTADWAAIVEGEELWFYTDGQTFDLPDAIFGDRANIRNGGTAQVTTSVPAPGALVLGGAAVGNSGTVEVLSGGTLEFVAGTGVSGTVSVGVAGTGVMRVLPGGTMTAVSSLSTGADAADTVVVGAAAGTLTPTATLTVGSAALNGTTQVFPNAAFTTAGNGNVSFGNASVYTAEINSTGTGRISAGGNLSPNGTVRLNYTGVSPTLGTSYTVAEADGFNNLIFDAITTNASIASNRVFSQSTVDIGGARKQLRLTLEESIVLEVNRNTGVAQFTNPGGGTITLDSYFIGSAGSLVPANFNGIDDQDLLGGNWIESTATATNISEFKPNLTGNFLTGGTIPLGGIFNPMAGGFAGADEEDLQFVYSRSSATADTFITGIVKYTGTKVNNLILQVDPTGAGDAYIRNTSDTTVSIDAYDILSPNSRLSTSLWSSLDDQNLGGADVWVEMLDNSATQLSEVNQSFVTPSLTLAPGAIHNMGKLYLGGLQDLAFRYLSTSTDTATVAKVIYEAFTAGLPGDYNNDTFVDAADYTVWRNNLGSNVALNGNGDETGASAGVVDEADYIYWKRYYGTSGGGGGISTAVPEPATWTMLAVAASVFGAIRRRQSIA